MGKKKSFWKRIFKKTYYFYLFVILENEDFYEMDLLGFFSRKTKIWNSFWKLKGSFMVILEKKIWSLFSRGWKVPWTFEKWMSIIKGKSFVNFGKMLLRDKNFQRFFHNILHTMNFGVRFVSLKSRHPELPFEYTKVS